MKRLSIILISLYCSIPLFAEWQIRGHVLEYDGTSTRKPVPHVEISVMGAGSVVSDQKGNFVLKFRVLKPGDKVNVHRIVKSGYEVFNKDEVESWVIPSNQEDVFNIVLCSSGKMSQMRQLYKGAAVKNINKQIVNQEKTYSIELKKGIINKQEYEQKISRMKAEMEKRLYDADEFLEMFVHTDVTALHKREKNILKQISKGRFEEAMAMYEKENLIGKFVAQVRVIDSEYQAQNKLRTAIDSHRQERDSLFSAIMRHANLLSLSGGKDNIAKVGELYKLTVNADTTYLKSLRVYGDHLYGQLQYQESYDIFSIYERNAQDKNKKLYGQAMSAACLRMLHKNNEASERLKSVLLSYDSIGQTGAIRGLVLYHLGQVHLALKQPEKSIEYYKQSLQEYEREYQLDTLDRKAIYNLSRVECALGAAYDDQLLSAEAEKMHLRAIEHTTTAYNINPRAYLAMMGYTNQYLARCYDCWEGKDMFDKALEHYFIAESFYKQAVDANPQAYAYFLGLLYSDLGTGYYDHGRYEEAIAALENSNSVFEDINTHHYGYQDSCDAFFKFNNGYIEKSRQALQQDVQPTE